MRQLTNSVIVVAVATLLPSAVWADLVPISKLPPYPSPKELPEKIRRGKFSVFQAKPSTAKVTHDTKAGYRTQQDKIANERHFRLKDVTAGATKIEYVRVDGSFSGAYVMIAADLSGYKTLSFLVKGRRGGEAFEVGLNDYVAHQREDAVKVGSIYRYLPKGVTKKWQVVKIPLADFHGIDQSKIISLVFMFNEVGVGDLWIDEVRFSDEKLINWKKAKASASVLEFDNFDHSDLNLLGRKASTYKRLPSLCTTKRVSEPRSGKKGRSLEIHFRKRSEGWCGYYSLLNEVDGAHFDLSAYKTLSFQVKGRDGGETFELGLADKRLQGVGDSNKAGPVNEFLQGPVTVKWQNVRVPLSAFERQGPMDFSKMGSLVFNFHQVGEGYVYIEDVRFERK